MENIKHGSAILFLLAMLFVFGDCASAFAHDSDRAYIVLGDSVDFGIGSTTPENAWISMFHEFLESSYFAASADLHNFSVPGATTSEIMRDQLAAGVSAVESHSPVVSWGGGGNDLLNFINSPQAATCLMGETSCVARLNALLNNIENVLDLMVRRIRAAGPSTPILLRTQYNPLLKSSCGGADDSLAQLANLVLEGSSDVPFLSRGLNDRIRDVAGRYNAKVIEIFLVFAYQPDHYIAEDCIHPNDAGHEVIWSAAYAAF